MISEVNRKHEVLKTVRALNLQFSFLIVLQFNLFLFIPEVLKSFMPTN